MQGGGDVGREQLQRRVRQTDEPRSQERRRAQVGRRVREIPQQREHVLDLVGVEEPEPFVDVGGDTPCVERGLERLVALARSEQDPDVTGPDGTPQPALLVAHLARDEKRVDRAGHALGARRRRGTRHETQHRLSASGGRHPP